MSVTITWDPPFSALPYPFLYSRRASESNLVRPKRACTLYSPSVTLAEECKTCGSARISPLPVILPHTTARA